MDFLHSSVDGKRPSGVSIPWILRQRFKQPPQPQQASDASTLAAASANAGVQERSPFPGGALSGSCPCSVDPQSVFSSQEIDDRLLRTSQALAEIQKQIQRGEETYYEETQAYYNSSLFRGFDSIIDARAINSNNSLNSNHSGHHLHNNSSSMSGGGNFSSFSNSSQSSGPRRMPADFRWFSSSSTSIPTRRHHGTNNTKPSSSTTAAASRPATTLPPPTTNAGAVSAAAAAASSSQVVQVRSSGVGIVTKNAVAATATGGHSGQTLPLVPPPSGLQHDPSTSTGGGNRGTKRCTSAPTVVVGQKRPCLDTTATSKTAPSATPMMDTTATATAAAGAAIASSANVGGAAVPSSSKNDDASASTETAVAINEEGTSTSAAPAATSAATSSSSATTAPSHKTGEAKSGTDGRPRGRPPGKSDSSKRRPKRKRAGVT